MPKSLNQIIETCEKLWPSQLAEDWDRPGLVVGDVSAKIQKVLLTVDITKQIVEDAVSGGFDLIIAHHPYLLKGVNSLAESTAKGAALTLAIKNDIAIFSAHTNADVTPTGVSATLAKALGISSAKPIIPIKANIGHGRIGKLSKPMSLVDFARQVAKALPATASGVRVAGDAGQQVSTIALCGGAGDSFIEAAIAAKADVFVTSDLRHHPTQDALAGSEALGKSMGLIDISHWAAESLWLFVAAKELGKIHSDVKFEVSDLRTDPWDFTVTQ